MLLWFTRGQGRITINGRTSGYTAHTTRSSSPAGTMHGFEMSSSVAGVIVVFPAGIEDQLDLPEEPVHLRLTDADQHIELNRLIGGDPARARERRHHRFRPRADEPCGLLSVWLERQLQTHEVEEQKEDATTSPPRPSPRWWKRSFTSPRPCATAAAALGVTPTHLSRVCNSGLRPPRLGDPSPTGCTTRRLFAC
ncbi:MAG: hypothetical protein R3D59_17695 [Paracoccaceae bacterium]